MIFFCHKNKLRKVQLGSKLHGLYTLTWGVMLDAIEEIENIYKGA